MPLTETALRPVFQKLKPADFDVSEEQLQAVLESILQRGVEPQSGDVRPAEDSEHQDAPAAKKRKVTKK